jgi:hypothetical protein
MGIPDLGGCFLCHELFMSLKQLFTKFQNRLIALGGAACLQGLKIIVAFMKANMESQNLCQEDPCLIENAVLGLQSILGAWFHCNRGRVFHGSKMMVEQVKAASQLESEAQLESFTSDLKLSCSTT